MKYPKMIIDECSGIEVPSELYKAYMVGIQEMVEWIRSDPSHNQDVGGIDAVVVFKEKWESKLKELELE